jgi:hypothetical protein
LAGRFGASHKRRILALIHQSAWKRVLSEVHMQDLARFPATVRETAPSASTLRGDLPQDVVPSNKYTGSSIVILISECGILVQDAYQEMLVRTVI